MLTRIPQTTKNLSTVSLHEVPATTSTPESRIVLEGATSQMGSARVDEEEDKPRGNEAPSFATSAMATPIPCSEKKGCPLSASTTSEEYALWNLPPDEAPSCAVLVVK